MSSDVFISYSHKNESIAMAVVKHLEDRGSRCWIAPRDILLGNDWAEAIIEGINKSRVFLLILSAHSNRSAQVLREVNRAANRGIPIIVFRIEDIPLSKKLEYYTGTSQWFDSSTPLTESDLDFLAGSIDKQLKPGKPEPAVPVAGKRGVRPRRRPRYMLLLLAAGVLVSVLAVSGFQLGRFNKRGEFEQVSPEGPLPADGENWKEAAAPPDSSLVEDLDVTPQDEFPTDHPNSTLPGLVTINSTPSGASVKIGNSLVGTTPITELKRMPGDYPVQITKNGYVSFSQTLTVQSGDTATVNAGLIARLYDIEFSSEPPGATVLFEDIEIGVAPCAHSGIRAGEHKVEFHLAGHSAKIQTVRVGPGRPNSLSVVLEQALGELTIRVLPIGSIRINGNLVTSNSNVPYLASLAAGSYRVVAEHPTMGRWTRQIELVAGDEQSVVFDFDQTVKLIVTSRPSYAKVYIDGAFTSRYTPCELKLTPGDRTVEVRKDDYRLIEGARNITLDRRTSKPLNFAMERIP